MPERDRQKLYEALCAIQRGTTYFDEILNFEFPLASPQVPVGGLPAQRAMQLVQWAGTQGEEVVERLWQAVARRAPATLQDHENPIQVLAHAAESYGNSLEIDDVIVSKRTSYVELDVRVRNAGETVVNITRADLHILKRTPLMAAYQPSASYDLLLEGAHNIIAVAHLLQPNEVDRFIIRIGFTQFNTSCRFDAQLILQYNNDQRSASNEFCFSSTFSSRHC